MPDGNVTRPPNSGNRSAPTFADWQARSAALQLKRDGQELRGPCPSCGGTDRFSVGEREGRTLLQCRHCDPNGRTQGGKDAYRKIMEGAGFSGERSTATGRRRAPPKSPLERPPDGTYLEPFRGRMLSPCRPFSRRRRSKCDTICAPLAWTFASPS